MSLDLDRSTWRPVTLGEVARASKENWNPADGTVGRYVAGEHMNSNDLKIRRWGDVGDGYLGPAFHRRFRSGQVLYGSRRTYLRKVAFADFDGVCANTTFVVESRAPDVLLPEFLPWVMTSEPFHARAIAESKGSVNPYVNWPDIARFEFALPPLDEQKRIADLLWAAERHAIANETRLRALALAQGEMVERMIRQMGGAATRLSDVLGIVRGGSPRPINDYFTEDENGHNWIKIGDVPSDGKYIDATAQRIKPTGLNRTRRVAPGDLLLSNSMSFGRPYIVRIDGCIHDGWLALTDEQGLWRTEFLYYLLRTRDVQSQFSQGAGGSTVKNLNTEVVGAVEVRLPTLEDQDRLLEKVAESSAAVDSVMVEIEAFRALRAAASRTLVEGTA